MRRLTLAIQSAIRNGGKHQMNSELLCAGVLPNAADNV